MQNYNNATNTTTEEVKKLTTQQKINAKRKKS